MSDVRCLTSDVWCLMFDVRCSISGVWCHRCLISDVRVMSVMRHRTSDIKQQKSNIRHWTSDTTYWVSVIRHQTLDIRHPTSEKWHRTSDIWNETSDIRHWTSDIGHQSSYMRTVLPMLFKENSLEQFAQNVINKRTCNVCRCNLENVCTHRPFSLFVRDTDKSPGDIPE